MNSQKILKEKSQHVHMKQIVLPSTILEFMIDHRWCYGRKYPKWKLAPPNTKGSQEI